MNEKYKCPECGHVGYFEDVDDYEEDGSLTFAGYKCPVCATFYDYIYHLLVTDKEDG